MVAERERRWWGFLARLAVTVICCAALVAWIDGHALWSHMLRLSPVALLAVLSLHAFIVILLGWRWRSIVQALGQTATFGWATRLTFATTFFNMVLPLSVGGDVGRVWLGRQAGIDQRTGTTVAILDRVAGLIGLGILLFLSTLFLPATWLPREAWLCMMLVLPAMLVGLWLIASFSGAELGRWFALQWLSDVAANTRLFLRSPWPLCLAVAQSLLAHLLAVTIVFMTARGLDITLTFSNALLLVPVILLATMLPFSIGGWGLREAAAIAVLSLVAVPPEGALALALMFGITQVAVGGAGTLLCLRCSGLRPAPHKP